MPSPSHVAEQRPNAVTAPTKGTLGNCASASSHGSSCHFTCADGVETLERYDVPKRVSACSAVGALQRCTNVTFTSEAVTGSGINPPDVVPFNKADGDTAFTTYGTRPRLAVLQVVNTSHRGYLTLLELSAQLRTELCCV